MDTPRSDFSRAVVCAFNVMCHWQPGVTMCLSGYDRVLRVRVRVCVLCSVRVVPWGGRRRVFWRARRAWRVSSRRVAASGPAAACGRDMCGRCSGVHGLRGARTHARSCVGGWGHRGTVARRRRRSIYCLIV